MGARRWRAHGIKCGLARLAVRSSRTDARAHPWPRLDTGNPTKLSLRLAPPPLVALKRPAPGATSVHKNVLLPAKERIEEALNFGGTQEITAGSRARMQVRAVRERERASNEPSWSTRSS